MPPMVIENLGSPVQNGQDISCGYEFSENLLKNIAIQVKSPNFRKGKNWKAVMGGLPIPLMMKFSCAVFFLEQKN